MDSVFALMVLKEIHVRNRNAPTIVLIMESVFLMDYANATKDLKVKIVQRKNAN